MTPVPLTILLIEDDPDQILLYQTYFDLEPDFELAICRSGRDAPTLAVQIKPQFILLDLLLTDINGLEVLKTLKAEAETKDIPVAIITNFYKEDLKQKAKDLGAAGYWLKTEIMPHQMIERIRGIVNPPTQAGED